ncbi:MAG TPA: hypothetical protein ENK19_05525 [Acidobacteria bacterium]|nr:hypothetical protein [Acidobacteriota bacterium]
MNGWTGTKDFVAPDGPREPGGGAATSPAVPLLVAFLLAVAGWPLAKFVHVDAVPVDAADYQDPARSGPCLLPLPSGSDTRGYLLFGGGLWTQSDVYLAFVARTELEAAVADPGRTIEVSYFKGASRDGKCWSTDQKDAVAVVNGYDNTSYARYELACGNHVVQDTVGTGYISVTPLMGTLSGGRTVDRLLMLFNSGYVVCLAGEGDACCGGTPVDGGRMCADVDGERYADRLVEGNADIVFITGERWRPWIWNTTEAPSEHGGVVPAAMSRPLVPVTIPPDPAANWYGAGPVCKAVLSDTGVINGYAPLAIDAFTRVSRAGDGFDVYFLLSRWGAKRTPDDPGDKDQGYNYMVDLFRTTVRPLGTPRARRPSAAVRPTPAQGRAAAPASSPRPTAPPPTASRTSRSSTEPNPPSVTATAGTSCCRFPRATTANRFTTALRATPTPAASAATPCSSPTTPC